MVTEEAFPFCYLYFLIQSSFYIFLLHLCCKRFLGWWAFLIKGKVTVMWLHVIRRHVSQFVVLNPSEFPTHQSCNRPPAAYWSVLCISDFFWASTFPTLLTSSEERHDEEKTPSNRSAERPISHSTICPSNDYLAALWCDTDGWRGSIANILSLSLYIFPQYSATDGAWSALCLFSA